MHLRLRGNRPVLVAAECGRFELAKEMVRRGSDPRAHFCAEGDSILNVVFRYLPREIMQSARGKSKATRIAERGAGMRRTGEPLSSVVNLGSEQLSDPESPFPDLASFDRDAAQFITWAVSKGVNPNLGSKNGVVPLQLAIDWGASECVQALIKGGANIHYVSHNGSSVLSDALTDAPHPNQEEILRALAEAGLCPETRADSLGIETYNDWYTTFNRDCAKSYWKSSGIETVADTIFQERERRLAYYRRFLEPPTT